MLIQTYKEQIKYNDPVPASTKSMITSFLKNKSLETTENTITFQEVMNYLRLNKLVLNPEIDKKGKTDEELLQKLLRSEVDLSNENKANLNNHYRWKKLTSGIYPQLNRPNHTALSLAALFGDESLVKNLINEGCDVNISINYGMTPLMVACQYASLQCIKLLLKSGADCNQVNEFKRTALDYAVKEGNIAAVTLLLAYGAKVDDAFLARVKENSPKDIFNLLTQASNSIKENRYPFMTKMIDEATPHYLCTDVSSLIASFDTRSYETRYFKKTQDNKKEPLFPDSEFLETTPRAVPS